MAEVEVDRVHTRVLKLVDTLKADRDTQELWCKIETKPNEWRGGNASFSFPSFPQLSFTIVLKLAGVGSVDTVVR